MGSYSYDRDVYSESSYSSWGASDTSKTKLSSIKLDESMDPKNKILKSKTKNPIIIALDVTGSNIDFARLIYDKFPMFYGELEQKGYLKDFEISICAIGDAYCDNYPIQVSDFSKGIEIDGWLEKLVLEAGGGWGIQESYELMAHYLLTRTEFERDAKPILFFIADEIPYDKVKISQAKDVGSAIQTEYDPFPKLNEKFNNNVYTMLNRYHGRFDESITDEWKKRLPAQHVIRIPEEKAIIDLILGVIAIQKKDLDIYALDMESRGQTKKRITGVKSSLKELSDSTALERVEEVNLPIELKMKPKKNTGKRL